MRHLTRRSSPGDLAEALAAALAASKKIQWERSPAKAKEATPTSNCRKPPPRNTDERAEIR